MNDIPPPRQDRTLSARFGALMVTRLGIAIMGVTGTVLLLAAGLGMLLAPSSVFRFVPDIEAALLSRGRNVVAFDSSWFALWTLLQFGFAALWAGVFFGAYRALPAQNRRVDAALRARLQPMVRGAPLEPRRGGGA